MRPVPDLTEALLRVPPWDPDDLADILSRLDDLRTSLASVEAEVFERFPSLHETRRDCARSLAHHVAFRREDLRGLRQRLRRHGLTTFEEGASHGISSLDTVRRLLRGCLGLPVADSTLDEDSTSSDAARARLERHAHALFGTPPRGRRVHRMVTLGPEAAADPDLTRRLIESGMSVARIDCAHDDERVWTAIAARVRQASRVSGEPCRVLIELAGPKLRTGTVEPGPAVVHWSPARDARGQLLAPARVFLSASAGLEAPPVRADAVIPLPADWVAALSVGDAVEFTDLRGRHRRLDVVSKIGRGALTTCEVSAWLEPGTRMALRPAGHHDLGSDVSVGWLPPSESRLTLRVGELLVLTRDAAPGRPASRDASGRVLTPACIPCTLPEVFARARPDESVWLDDGKIGGKVRSAGADAVVVEITHAKPLGSRLAADKGIHLPDTDLAVACLTAKDVEDLSLAVRDADIVGLSFVSDATDVTDLFERLRREGVPSMGVLAKIETRRGFSRLPEILLAGMEGFPFGVRISRGDLVLECGPSRSRAVEEQALSMCEAAHVPVAWSTQVLESLGKKGPSSRAEIVDAVSTGRAPCVMLDGGPQIVPALEALDGLLRRAREPDEGSCTKSKTLRIAALEEPP